MSESGREESSRRTDSARERAEAELVERLKACDESSIQQVYRLHADSIYRFALYQLGDPAGAEDVVGEVFVRMMESIGTYSYRGLPISAWLFRIARNLVVDHQRRGGRLKQLEDLDESRLESDNPVDFAERVLTWDELSQSLAELTEEQRQIIVLKFVENLENREVAEIVGKTEGSVKSLQHRALRSLRRVLEKRGSYAARA